MLSHAAEGDSDAGGVEGGGPTSDKGSLALDCDTRSLTQEVSGSLSF